MFTLYKLRGRPPSGESFLFWDLFFGSCFGVFVLFVLLAMNVQVMDMASGCGGTSSNVVF